MSSAKADSSAAVYRYQEHDALGHRDKAIAAYGSRYVDQMCVRAGAWKHGKALVRFLESDDLVIVRTRLLRRVRAA